MLIDKQEKACIIRIVREQRGEFCTYPLAGQIHAPGSVQ